MIVIPGVPVTLSATYAGADSALFIVHNVDTGEELKIAGTASGNVWWIRRAFEPGQYAYRVNIVVAGEVAAGDDWQTFTVRQSAVRDYGATNV